METPRIPLWGKAFPLAQASCQQSQGTARQAIPGYPLRRAPLLAMLLLLFLSAGNIWGQSRMPADANNWLVAAYRSASDWYGDVDKVQVIFFEVDASVSETLYVGINDPGTDAADNPLIGAPNYGDMIYRVYGGTNAYTSANSRLLAYTSPALAYDGTLLWNLDIAPGTGVGQSQHAGMNNQWVYSSALSASQGELVGTKRLFKMVIISGTAAGDDYVNRYQVAISKANSGDPVLVTGVRAFAYSLSVSMLGDVATGSNWYVYPYVPASALPGSDLVLISSYDGDYRDQPNATVTGFRWRLRPWDGSSYDAFTLIAPSGDNSNDPGTGAGGTSAQGVESASIAAGRIGRTWQLEMEGGGESGGGEPNGVDVWASFGTATVLPPPAGFPATEPIGNKMHTGGQVPLRLYSSEYIGPTADHVVILPATQTLLSATPATANLSLQIVDSNGEAVLESRTIRLTTNLGSINGVDADELVTTNTSGIATFTVVYTGSGIATVTPYTDGSSTAIGVIAPSDNFGAVGGDIGATIEFTANPPPLVSSSSNSSGNIGANIPLNQLVINANGGSMITTANDIRIRLNPAYDLVADLLDNDTTLTLSLANAGTTTIASQNYAGGVLTIDVATANFGPTTTLTIGLPVPNTTNNLSLTAASGAGSGYLQVSVDGGSTWIDDNKILTSIDASSLTWNGGSSIDWATAANWSPATVPTLPPQSVVVTNQTNDPTFAIGADLTLNNLTIQAGGILTLTGTNRLTVSTLTIGAGATLALGGAGLTVTGAVSNDGIISLNGTVGQMVLSSGNDTNSGTVVYSGTSAGLAIGDYGVVDYYNLTINGTGGTFTSPLSLAIAGSLVRSNGTFTHNSGTVTLVGTGTHTISGFSGTSALNNLTQTGTGSYTLGSAMDLSGALSVSAGTLDISGRTVAIGGSLSLTGSSMLTITAGSSISLTGVTATVNITTSSSGSDVLPALTLGDGTNAKTITLLTDMEANNGLSIQSNAILVTASFGINLSAGSFSNLGTLRLQGGETLTLTNDVDSGLVEFVSGGANLSGLTSFYDVSITGGTHTLVADITVARDLSIGASGTLDVSASNYKITLGRNWSMAGTFTPRSGIVEFNNASLTSILSGNTTFSTLRVVTGLKTLQFTTGTTTRVSTFDITGSAGNLIVLQGTAAAAWTLRNDGSAGTVGSPNMSYVNVQWSQIDAAGSSIMATNATDGGNNDLSPAQRWIFRSGTNISTTWNGSQSTAWADDNNWSNGAPVAGDTAIIADVTNDPVASASIDLDTLTVNSGAILRLGTQDLTVDTTITMDGTLELAGTQTISLPSGTNYTTAGTWVYTGTSTIKDYGTTDYYNLTLASGSDSTISGITVAGALNIGSGTAATVSNTGALVVTGATTINIGAANDLTLDNASNNFSTVVITSGNNISLRDTNAITLAASTVAGNLTVLAGDDILDTGTLAITGQGSFETRALAGVGLITLDDDGAAGGYTNNFGSLVLRTMDAAGTAAVATTVTVYENSATDLAGIRGAGSMTITSAGAVIDSGDLLEASLSVVSVGGTTLDAANTLVGFAATNSTSGGVTLSSNTATTLTLGLISMGAGTGSIAISNTGNISASAAVSPQAGQTISISALGAGASLSTSASVGAATGAGTVTLTADTMAIGATVQSGSGAITILPATTTRPISLGTGAVVGTLGLSQAELLNITTSGTLLIGGATISGAISTDGTLDLTGGGLTGALHLRNTTGGMTLNNAITTNGNRELWLTSTGGIDGTGAITTGTAGLGVSAGGAINLTNTVVATIAATTTNGTLTISNTRAGGLAVGTVNGVSGLSTTTGSGGAISLTETSGAVALGQAVSAANGSTISLSSAGAMTQTAAISTTGGLRLLGAGAKTLTQTTNSVATLAALISGSGNALSYVDADAFAVGILSGTNGIQTNGGAVTLNTNAVASISLSVAAGTAPVIDTSAGGVAVSGGAITLSRAVLLTTSSRIRTAGATNGADIGFAGVASSISGAFDLDLVAGNEDIVVPAAATVTGLGALTITSAKNVAGDAAAGSATGSWSVDSFTQTAGTGTTRLGILTTNVGAVSISSSGTIRHDGAVTSATSYGASGGAVDINATVSAPSGFSSSGSSFDNTLGTITTTDNALSITHTGAVTVGAALSSGSGALTVDSSGSTVAINAGISVSTGQVEIDSLTGTTVAAAGDVNASGGATVDFGANRVGTLTTAGDVTTNSGTITYHRAVALSANVLVNTGALVAGDIVYLSTIDNSTATARTLGLTAGTGNVIIGGVVGGGANGALGAITISSASTVAGNVGLTAATASISAASLTQSAGTTKTWLGAVTTSGAVALTTTAAVELDGTVGATGGFSSTGTTFDNTGATISATATAISINHTGAVTINAAISTTGVGTIDIDTTSTLGIAAGVTGGTGAVTIDANGLTTQTALVSTTGTGTITYGGTRTGLLSLGANVTTAGATITFTRAVTLASSQSISTGTSTGSIIFTSTLQGAFDIGLSSGVTTTFNQAVGTLGVPLGDGIGPAVNVSNGGVTFASNLYLASGMNHADGTWTARFQGPVAIDLGNTATTLSGNIQIDGVDFESDGAITLGSTGTDTLTLTTGAVSITTLANNSNITINASVSGPRLLTLTTNGSGTLTLNGDFATGGTGLTELQVNTSQLNLGTNADVSTGGGGTGDILWTLGGLTLGGTNTINAAGGSNNRFIITTLLNSSVVQFAPSKSTNLPFAVGDVHIDSDFSGITAAGGLVLGNSVHTGTLYLGNDLGAVTMPAALVIRQGVGASGVDIRNAYTGSNANLTINSDGGLAINTTGTIGLGAGSLVVGSLDATPVTLGANTTITANGAITINQAITNTTSRSLQLNSTGVTTLAGTVGTVANPLTSLTTNALGSTVISGGSIYTTGTQTFNDAVTVSTSALTLGTVNSAISFEQGYTGGSLDLTIKASTGTGTVTFKGAMTGLGNATGASLTVEAGQTGLVRFQSTVGGISGFTFADGTNVRFDDTVTLTAGDTANTFFGNATLDGLTLTSSQVVTFGNAPGSDTVTLSTGAVTIDTETANQNISFNAIVNGAQALTLEPGTGTLTFAGTLGATTALSSLTVDTTPAAGGSTVISGGQIRTSGAQTYNDAVTISTADVNFETTNANINFAQTFAGGSRDVTIDATTGTGTVTFVGAVTGLGTASGASLTVEAGQTGFVRFQSTVGGISGFTFADGTNVRFDDTVTLTAGDTANTFLGNATLDGLTLTSSQVVTFGNAPGTDTVTLSTGAVTIDTETANQNISFNAIVNGAQALTLEPGTGTLTFAGTVGATTSLSSLIVDTTPAAGGSTVISGGQIRTSGAQTYNDAVTISTADVNFETTNANINFAQTFAGGSRDVTIDAATGTGTVTFVGAVTGLGTASGASLTVEAGQTGLVRFQSTVGGISGFTFANGTNVRFDDTVTLTAGDTANTFLGNATLDGLTLTSSQVVTFGNAPGSDTVTLSTGAVTIDTETANQNISFNAIVNGAQALTLEPGTGTLTFAGTVGVTTALSSLIVDTTPAAGGSTVISGGQIRTSGAQAYNDAVTISNADVNFETTNANINFAQTFAGGSRDVTIDAATGTGTVTFVGAVTGLGTASGASLTVEAGQTGLVRFQSTVGGISGFTFADGTNVRFDDTVTLTAGDTANTFLGNATLDGLTITSSQAVTFGNANTDIVTLSGGAVTITTSTANSNQTFNSQVRGTQDFTSTAGTGTVSLNSSLGSGGLPLVTIAVTAGTINFGNIDTDSITASGNLTFTASVGTGFIGLRGSSVTTTGSQTYIANATATSSILLDLHGDGTYNAGSTLTFTTPWLFMDNQIGAGTTWTLADNISVSGDMVLYSGRLNQLLGRTITIGGNLAVFGSAFSADDPDRSASTEYEYPGFTSMNAARTRPGTPSANFGATTASGLDGVSIRVGGNFYVNGANLDADASWNLWLPNNNDVNGLLTNGFGDGTASGRFARVFESSVENLTVLNSTGLATDDVWLSAAEGVTDGGSNTRVAFVANRPSIASGKTIYDDMVELIFTQHLENSNQELAAIVGTTTPGDYLRFDGAASYFQGLYFWNDQGASGGTDNWIWEAGEAGIWLDMTTAPDFASYKALSGSFVGPIAQALVSGGDVPQGIPLYFRTHTNGYSAGSFSGNRTGTEETWNTDATGLSAGAAESTNRAGINQAGTTVDLALAKHRIYGAWGKVTMANTGITSAGTYDGGTAYTGTSDGTGPVFLGAWVGKHDEAVSSAMATDPYNRHNLIHLRYSEPLDLTGLSGSVNTSSPATINDAIAVGSNGAFRSRYITGTPAEQFAALKENTNGGVTITGLNLVYGDTTSTFKYGVRPHATLAPGSNPATLPEAWREGGHLIYRSNTATKENPAGLHGLTIFIGGFSVDNGSERFWPTWLGESLPNYDPDPLLQLVSEAQGNTIPGGVFRQLVAPLLRDSAANSVEPTANIYPGKDGGTTGIDTSSAGNLTDPVTIASITTGGAGFGGGLGGVWASSWDITHPIIPYEGSFRKIYTTLDIQNRMASFQFVTEDATGGIRDTAWRFPSSGGEVEPWDDEVASFRFNEVGSGNPVNTYNQQIVTGIQIPETTPPYALQPFPDPNDIYFGVEIDPAGAHGWGVISSMEVTFSPIFASTEPTIPGAYITDHAGNLLKGSLALAPWAAIERTPPNVQYALGSVGGSKVFVHFDEPVFHEGDFSQIKASDFIIYDGATAHIPVGIEILETQDVAITGKGIVIGTVSVYLILPPSLTITSDKLYSLRIAGASSAIPALNNGSVVDKGSTPLQINRRYRYSNIAIGTATPVLAMNDMVNPATGLGVEPMTRFDGTGMLPGDGPVLIQVKNDTSASSVLNSTPMRMYFDAAVPDGIRAKDTTYWLPQPMAGFAPNPNGAARSLAGNHLGNGLHEFVIRGDSEFKTDALIEFILEQNGLTLGWTPDVNKPDQVRPWSFQYGAVIDQRAGVTILNNVINPEAGDRAILQYKVSTPGSVNIMVFTLDGNLVRVLQRGRQAAGEYRLSWDGKNSGGQVVARGMYMIRAVGPGFDEFRKVLVVKP